MNIDEILQAVGGPVAVPHQPEGGAVVPLNTGGLDKTAPEPFPAVPNAQQGAGAGSGGLYPNPGEPADSTIHVGGNAPDSSAGPGQLPASPGLGALTAGGNFGANRPLGSTAPLAAPVGRPDHALGRDQSLGQGINPMLKPANAPKQDGPFGKPSL